MYTCIICTCVCCFFAHVDLQLAATVGKMLLEKNSSLEEKLLKLQFIVEQTKVENDVSMYRWKHMPAKMGTSIRTLSVWQYLYIYVHESSAWFISICVVNDHDHTTHGG